MSLTASQSRAVAARGNVIVVAGAGTGKTSTLVERCLDVLREGASLESILMVTFTEAAAAEMRHRLRHQLQRLVETGADTAQRERLAEQLALVESAPISTLHSFCLALVRSHFHELGVDPDPNVLDESQCRALAEETLERLFEECYAGTQPWQIGVRSLIAVYAPDRDQLVRQLVLQLHRYTQSLPDAQAWLAAQAQAWGADGSLTSPGVGADVRSSSAPGDSGVASAGGLAMSVWERWLIEGFRDWQGRWQPLLQAHAGIKNIDECLAAMGSMGCDVTRADVARVAGAVAVAGTAAWPRGMAGSVRDPLKACFEEAQFLAAAAVPGALEADWQAVRDHMVALLALTTEFTARFTRAKRDLGGLDFSDLEQLALQLLRGAGGQSTAVAEAVRAQFAYVFVDECQDINAAQDAILSAISRTGAEANRFLVGDVKQSIYQFRRADPRIFRRYEQAWGGAGADETSDPTVPGAGLADGGQRIVLAENFRSRPRLIEFVNTLFGALMCERFGGVPYEPLQPGPGRAPDGLEDGPCVELHVLRTVPGAVLAVADEGEGEAESLSAIEREARLVAGRLRGLKESGFQIWDKRRQERRAVEWGDMAVLLRSPGPRAEAFAKEFHRAGIPLAAARAGFFEAIEVSDLVNLLRLLDNPLQDIPLLAVLRSPLVGLTLDELAALRVSNDRKPFWRALTQFVVKPGDLGGTSPTRSIPDGESAAEAGQAGTRDRAALWERLRMFLEQFGRWRELARQAGPSLCLEQVLTDTNYDVLLGGNDRGREQAANVGLLLEYARQFDPYRRQGLFRFLQFIDSLEATDAAPEPVPVRSRDAVQLMSIHRSKGLEFPVVVLAALGGRFNLQELNSLLLLDAHYGLAPKAHTPAGTSRYPTLPFWLAERRQRAQRLGEELRLLYVATTRARDRLILTGSWSGKDPEVWTAAPTSGVSEQTLIAARCPLDWIEAWFPGVTQASDWTDADHGATGQMTWEFWNVGDPRLASPAQHSEAGQSPEAGQPVAVPSLATVAHDVSWVYGPLSATTEPAKSSVSALRRRALELADEEALPRFNGSRAGSLSAAERGTLHHRFLQWVRIDQADRVGPLSRQLRELVEQGLFSPSEAELLDLAAVAGFWASEVGRTIAGAADRVRRELPFTVRLGDVEVRALLGQAPDPALEAEFVVVQGVVDLVVLLDDQLWLLDFKTDDVEGEALEQRVREYTAQLWLYAAALEKVFGKPVVRQWLHFLTCGRTVEVHRG
jgi:ATP-dependent helicase/nuclease subunit A